MLVVGEVDRKRLHAACRQVEQELRIEVNPVVVNPEDWAVAEPESFVSTVKSRPIVTVFTTDPRDLAAAS